MASKPPPKKKAPPRSRYQLDISEEMRERWEAAAEKTGQVLASFVRSAVEEKIRRDGLDKP